MAEILSIVQRQFKLDFRNIASIASVLLFMIGAAFIALKSFVTIHAVGWVALFWILFLFSIINFISQSFGDKRLPSRISQYIYFRGSSVVIGLWVYNYLFALTLGIGLQIIMIVFFNNPIKDIFLFNISLALGTLGLCTVLTFVSLLTSSIENTHVLASILSLPLSLPFLLLSIKICVVSLGVIQDTSVYDDCVSLAAMGLAAVGVTIFLYPSLWKS